MFPYCHSKLSIIIIISQSIYSYLWNLSVKSHDINFAFWRRFLNMFCENLIPDIERLSHLSKADDLQGKIITPEQR